ncbi:MAG: ABC transporter ATP-binding protein, partial [Ruminococcus sp.]|nr:ABC transporter ATP-binding protein [Ruminococcus sp.]
MAGPMKHNPAVTGKKPTMNKEQSKTLKRLFAYIMKRYKFRFIFVFLCIIVTSIVSALSAKFVGGVFDDYISTLIGAENPNFAPLLGAITRMAIIFLFGVVATLSQNLIMNFITQGMLRSTRDDM